MSTTGAAQRHLPPDNDLDPTSPEPLPAFHLTEPPPLRREVAARVAAHRARRGLVPTDAEPVASPQPTRSRTSRVRSANIAAAVAERYAQSQSYRSFLAAEAERAVHRAEVAAQVATINAQAIAVAQQQLLDDLDSWTPPSTEQPANPLCPPIVPLSPGDFAALFDREFAASTSHVRSSSAVAPEPEPVTFARYTAQPYADDQHPLPALPNTPLPSAFHSPVASRDLDEDERLALEEEIEFRHHPVFNEPIQQLPVTPNLIEFPRQLVAARKARPRIAEGPLRDEMAPSSSSSQLRIFEVEPEHIAFNPSSELSGPEWSSILLSAQPAAEFAVADDLAVHPPQAAPIGRRLKAAVTDFALILAAEAAFFALFRTALTHLSGDSALFDIPHPIAAAVALATLAVFTLLYQLLFFTLSDATPGMRFARIGLCTFADENPSRSAMRRRIIANLLAAFPLGIGLLWALLDEDTLGWHDRISRMYQRAY